MYWYIQNLAITPPPLSKVRNYYYYKWQLCNNLILNFTTLPDVHFLQHPMWHTLCGLLHSFFPFYWTYFWPWTCYWPWTLRQNFMMHFNMTLNTALLLHPMWPVDCLDCSLYIKPRIAFAGARVVILTSGFSSRHLVYFPTNYDSNLIFYEVSSQIIHKSFNTC